jgi:ribonuclease HI
MHDPYALKIYIDGSAYRNPGHEGGLAGIAEFPESLNREPEPIFEESFDRTTNNRMELRACLQALEYVRANARSLGISRAIILTDSEHVNEHHKSAPFWRKNGWRNRHGRPVENKDLWKEFLSLRQKVGVRIDIAWNLGKSTAVLRAVDKLAKKAAKNLLKRKDSGYRPGKVSRHKTEDRGAATLFPANNQELIIRVYAHTLVGKSDCRVSFTVFSEAENKFTQKRVAYVTGSDKGEIHRHHCYRVRFNDNPNYPVFEIVEVLGNCPGSPETATGKTS